MSSLLFLVAWDRPDLWDYLRRWFSEVENVEVVLDRRRGERRRSAGPEGPERRRTPRRRQPALDAEVRATGFAITYRHGA